MRSVCKLPLLVLCTTFAAAAQTTIHIPADQPTIQAGINAAQNGDTVLVAPGTYYENIDFEGKAITVTSAAGPQTTVLDGNGHGTVVSFTSGELRSSVLFGFTIRNAGPFTFSFTGTTTAYAGGGIYVQQAAPTLDTLIVTGNACIGINIVVGAPLIQNSTITATQPYNGTDQNTCPFNSVTGVMVRGTLGTQGFIPLPIAIQNLSPTINKNVISDNVGSILASAIWNGQGIVSFDGDPVIENNVITRNSVRSPPNAFGGGIYIADGGATVVQNLIYGNHALYTGGGVAFASPSGYDQTPISLINNVIADNTTDGVAYVANGSQFYSLTGQVRTLANNVFSGSTSAPLMVCTVQGLNLNTTLTLSHNDAYNSVGPTSDGSCDGAQGNGNFFSDPLFSRGSYVPLSGSPLIDAGDNSAIPQLPLDFAGNPRVVNSTGLPQSVIDIGAYEFQSGLLAVQTSLTLSSSSNPATVHQPVTFTVHVAAQSASNGTPTGSVAFSDGGNPLGTLSVNSSGTATLTVSTLTVGSRNITATYLSTGSFAGSSASLVQVVQGLAVSAVLSASPVSPAAYGTAEVLTATVAPSAQTNTAVTGTVSFLVDGITTSSGPVSSGAAGSGPVVPGVAAVSISTLAPGLHTLSCMYSGDSIYNAATCAPLSFTVTAAPTALTLSSSANPGPALTGITFQAMLTASGVPLPNASLTFTLGGTSLALTTDAQGIATSPPFTLTPGQYTANIVYAASATYLGSAAGLTEIVNSNPTITSITASPNPGFQNQVLTFSITVAAKAGTASPSGVVALLENGVTLAQAVTPFSVPNTPHTIVSLTLSTLSAGPHTFVAVFIPNINFVGSQSTPLTVTISPQDLQLSTASPALTVETEHYKSIGVSLTSIGGLSGTYTLACGTLPPDATCNWSNAQVNLQPGAAAAVQLEIDTDTVHHFKSQLSPEGGRFGMPGGGSSLPLLAIAPCLLLSLRKRSLIRVAGRDCSQRMILMLGLLLLPSALCLTGCGDKYPDHTPPGTYTIELTATGAANGNGPVLTRTTVFTLNVTQ